MVASTPQVLQARAASAPKRPKSDLSVGICTRNRPELLEQVINALTPQLNPLGISLIVVDSCSDAPQAEAIKAVIARNPGVQLLRMKTPGLSIARNAALEAAKTPWLAFIDDDEEPEPDWAVQAVALTERLPDDCAACGGNVTPLWPVGAPAPQLSRRWMDYLSIIIQDGEFDQSERPKFGGGHSIVRVSALRQVGGFNANLGRDGKTLLSGDEVLVIRQLLARGWRIWHSDKISVGHIITPDRLEPQWPVERAYWEGVSTARIMTLLKDPQLPRKTVSVRWKARIMRLAAKVLPLGQEYRLRQAFMDGFLAEMKGRAA